MKKFTLLVLFSALMLVFDGMQAQTVDVTFRVDMQDQTVSPLGVHMAGSFAAPLPTWNPAGISLTAPAIGFVYDTTIEMSVGYYLEYKFINGNAWGQDEGVPGACAQNGNRYLTVPANDTVLDVVCFGSCLPCVLPPVDVTFQVDMSNETVSPNGVHLAGSFQGWDPAATPMTDMGGNIYEVTLTLGEGEYHEFKYINGNAWGGDESVPPACAINNNRYYTVPSTNQTLPLVCFGSCDPCVTVTDINVTFQVDMSNETVAPEGVHIAGSFQGWDPAGTLMTDMGSGIWEYSFVLQSGTYHEYKFINGIAWGQDETVPWYCNQNNNRYLTVPESDTTLPQVCFSSCLVCNPPQVDITFQVDMSLQLVSDSGVHLAGTVQGWDPAGTFMTDAGNNVYQVTLTLGEGEWHEYKFINGNDWPGAENVPPPCANFGGNREFFVPSTNTTIDLVCFGECDPCVIPTNTFDIKVNLEGPFNGSDMNVDLHTANLIPFDQPYNTAPWNYTGSETYAWNVHDEVVDWVLMETRYSTSDAAGAIPANQLNIQAALLLADGSIVQTDGSSLPEFTGPTYADVYVLVWHRNHLAVMSSLAVVGVEDEYMYDFTDLLSKAYLDGQKELNVGIHGMIGGDSDGNGDVDTDDKNTNWNTDAGSSGYLGSDLNLDTQSNNPDKNDVWEPNDGMGTQVPL